MVPRSNKLMLINPLLMLYTVVTVNKTKLYTGLLASFLSSNNEEPFKECKWKYNPISQRDFPQFGSLNIASCKKITSDLLTINNL